MGIPKGDLSMKKTLLLVIVLTLGTSVFAQKRSKLSSQKLENALAACLSAKNSSEIIIKTSQHKQKIKVPFCGGTVSIAQVKKNGVKVPNFEIIDSGKCSYLTVGTNGNFKTKNVTRHYAMVKGYKSSQGGDNYGGNYPVAEELINMVDNGAKENNFRAVLHSGSGKTCAKVRVFLGNVY